MTSSRRSSVTMLRHWSHLTSSSTSPLMYGCGAETSVTLVWISQSQARPAADRSAARVAVFTGPSLTVSRALVGLGVVEAAAPQLLLAFGHVRNDTNG
jgi:hypothetical protein